MFSERERERTSFEERLKSLLQKRKVPPLKAHTAALQRWMTSFRISAAAATRFYCSDDEGKREDTASDASGEVEKNVKSQLKSFRIRFFLSLSPFFLFLLRTLSLYKLWRATVGRGKGNVYSTVARPPLPWPEGRGEDERERATA